MYPEPTDVSELIFQFRLVEILRIEPKRDLIESTSPCVKAISLYARTDFLFKISCNVISVSI
jgi:hypothetical protein